MGRPACRSRCARKSPDFRAVSADPVIVERLASIGTIMHIRGPAEFAKSIQEQRDKLVVLAKTLGLKAATQ